MPSTAQAFVAIRPAEMLKTAEMPELNVLIQERCGPTFGKLRLPVDKIAQITWVPAIGRRGQEDGPGNLVVYQMTEPYDFQELLRAEFLRPRSSNTRSRPATSRRRSCLGAVCFR